MLKTQEDVLY